MKVIWVNVDLREGCSDPDGAAGVWEVTLQQAHEPDIAAGAALDVFHQKVGISELEDFEISTYRADTAQEILEAETYVQGSCGGGTVERIANTLEELR